MNLALVPTLHGAVEAVDAGIVSTLQGQNERDNADAVEGAARRHRNRSVGGTGPENDGKEDSRFRLLFDPQVRNIASVGEAGRLCSEGVYAKILREGRDRGGGRGAALRIACSIVFLF